MTEHTDTTIQNAVGEARRRLAHVAGRELLVQRGLWVIVGATVIGGARPLYMPLDPGAPLWAGAAAAIAVMILAAVIGFTALFIIGWRRGPGNLAAARAIDGALDLKEVVASGFAFQRDAREGVLEGMATRHAVESLQGFSAKRAGDSFQLPGLRPRSKTVAKAAGLVALVAIFGSYHPALASILASPPSEREMSAAAELDELARHLEEGRMPGERDSGRERDRDRAGADDDLDPSRAESRRELARKAQAVARAARRGDREAAMRDLDDLRRSGESASRESEALRAALRQIAKALSVRPARGSKSSKAGSGEGDDERAGSKSGEARREGSKRGKSGEKAGRDKAGDAMKALAERLRRGTEGEGELSKAAKSAMRRAELEALARAVAHSASLSKSGSAAEREMAERLAKALSKAGEALGAGDREEAARRLEEAASRAAELEGARMASQREAEAIARLLKAAGALGRAMQASLASKSGRPGREGMSMGMAMMGAGKNGEGFGEGEGEGEGMGKAGKAGSSTALARALALRLAAMGMGGDPSGRPGTGPEGHADNWGAARSGLPVKGSMRARSAVDEGQMAVTAIQGMGRNADSTQEYRDVFPSYSALAEEAIGDEVVPAAQRQVVRRYFEAIRPGGIRPEAPEASDEDETDEEETGGGSTASE